MKTRLVRAFFYAAITAFLFSGNGFALERLNATPPDEGQVAEKQKNKYKEGEILVKFKKNVTDQAKTSKHGKYGAKRLKKFKYIDVELVQLASGMAVKKAVSQYKADPDVEYAEPNYKVSVQNTPNDTYFNNLWGLYNTGQTGGTANADISATRAWDITTGSNDGSVVVAVIDTGIDYNHEDLTDNLWVNSGEIGGNGIDDDGNGYVDDIYGINAITRTGNPRDDNGHGTHVAGTIGAVGNNNKGVVGVNWNVKILGCKFLDASGGGYTSDSITCLEYVRSLKDRGVNIVATNNSWGGSGYSQALYDAINVQMTSGILLIAAAGNSNSNNDNFPLYPANYNLPNVISVAATDHYDNKATFSSYGGYSVYIGAPGLGIVSLRAAGTDMYGDGQHFIPAGDPTAKYYTSNGTSMATPHVTGLAALIKSADAGRDWKTIKNLVLAGGDNLTSLNGITVTGKRINAYGSLTCSSSPVFAVLQAPTTFSAGEPLTLSVLSINCGVPVGPVTATTPSGEVIELHDDGIAPDLAAGDGVFTAAWTPPAGTYFPSYRFTSPNGEARVPAMAVISEYLLEGNIRYPYSFRLEAVSVIPPLTWEITSGSLPPGLALDPSTGEISGRPTVTGKFSFTVRVTDSEHMTASKELSLPVVDHLLLQEWAYPYGSSVSSDYWDHFWTGDIGSDIETDANGNIYVTSSSYDKSGYAFLAVKFENTGNAIWSRTFVKDSIWGDGPLYYNIAENVAVDSAGNVYVAGESLDGDYFGSLIKYDPLGNLLWTRSVWGSGATQPGRAGLVVDHDDNVYLSAGSGQQGLNLTTYKYDPAGNLLWQRSHISGDTAAMAVDSLNNIYVTGGSKISLYYQTVKYDPSGNVLWTRSDRQSTYNATQAIAVDHEGNAYVTGNFSENADPRSIWNVKYDSSGSLVWDFITSSAVGRRIAVDNEGYVYLGGCSFNITNGGCDLYIAKYDPFGNEIWKKTDDRGLNQKGSPMGLALDGNGNIFVTTYAKGGYLIKYKQQLHILTRTVLSGYVNIPYNQSLAAAGGPAPYSWSIYSGSLPPGLSLDGSTGIISGTPTAKGIFSFAVQVSDGSAAATKQFTLWISDLLTVTTPGLSPGMVGTDYSQTLNASGGWPPYTWSVSAGTLPPGLALDDASGAISGRPAASGTYIFTARATDNVKAMTDKQFTLIINPAPPTTTAYPPGGVYAAAQTVRLTADQPAAVYCTTDGSTPVIPGSLCTAPITVSASLTLKFFAVDIYGTRETLKTETYTITGGEIWAWGADYWGQLGDGTSQNIKVTPIQINQITDVISLVSSDWFSTAVKRDGTVWAWGRNDWGMLGNGTISYTPTLIPVQVIGLTDAVAVSSGQYFSLALKKDGTVWAWGRNHVGQLGDGTTTTRTIAVPVSGLTDAVAIAAGGFHSLALKKDGTAWAWGHNGYGQLGNGTTGQIPALTPVQVSVLTDAVAIASGHYYSMALKKDGTIWAWGDNQYGQLGDGTMSSRSTPVPVSGLTDVVAITSGGRHALALKKDGTVWAWGNNSYGQLGNVYTNNSPYPMQVTPVTGFTDIVAIAAGSIYSMALKNDGTVWAWGYNSDGELGDGTTSRKYTPVQVSGLSGANAIASGIVSMSSFAMKPLLTIVTASLSDGMAGDFYSQALAAVGGQQPYTWSLSTGSLPLPSGLTLNPSTGEISGTPAASGTYTFTVQVTDANGKTNTKDLSMTVYEPLVVSTSALAYGIVGAPYSQTLAATGGKVPYTWSLSAGSLPLPSGLTLNPSTGEISGTPAASGTYTFTVQVTDANGKTNTKDLSITVYEPLIITTTSLPSGEVNAPYIQVLAASGGLQPYAWSIISPDVLPPGLALDGAMGVIVGTPAAAGDFSFTVRVTDANTTATEKLLSIVINPDTTLPVTTANPPGGTYTAAQTVRLAANEPATIYCTTDGTTPVVPDSICAAPITVSRSLTLKFFAVDVSGNREEVKTETYKIMGGEVWAWGWNAGGQLGNETTYVYTSTALHVSGIAGAAAVTQGGNHSVALKNDGTVWAWGSNSVGQLGDGTTNSNKNLIPVQAAGLTDVTAVASGANHTVALKNDGTVWTWGFNYFGQIGDGTTTDKAAPVQVGGLTNVVAVAAGYSHTIALKKDGTVRAWGHNVFGQLGDGTTTSKTVPVPVSGLMNIIAVAAGGQHTIALKGDGTVWAWGYNYLGQLGDGTTINKTAPVQVSGLMNVISIACGKHHCLVMKNDGTLWAWGLNTSGQTGTYPTQSVTTPVQVGGLTDVIAVAGLTTTSGALRNDGTLWVWGSNSYGQLGDGFGPSFSSTPIQVNVADVAAIGSGSNSFHWLVITPLPPLTVLTAHLPDGTATFSYDQTLTASGGLPPYAWSITSGSLPSGLSLNGSTGEISGTPAVSGTSNFTVQVTDANGTVSTKALTITIYDPLIVTTAALPYGTVGAAYHQTLVATGGKTPYVWSVLSGSLPSGLGLNGLTGEIAGTPTASGFYSFTVQVTDANGTASTKQLSIPVYDPLVITTSSLAPGLTGKNYSQTLSATGGLAPYSWSVAAGSLPGGLNLNSSTGEIAGVPSVVGTFTFTLRITDANGTFVDKELSITIDYPDDDGDGHKNNVDCNDHDPTVYPGAPETKHDGIDQDCNGYDLTINIVKAHYISADDSIRVEATSALGPAANLQLAGWGPMIWRANQLKWVISIQPAGGNPGTVTVSGTEGSESVPTVVQ